MHASCATRWFGGSVNRLNGTCEFCLQHAYDVDPATRARALAANRASQVGQQQLNDENMLRSPLLGLTQPRITRWSAFVLLTDAAIVQTVVLSRVLLYASSALSPVLVLGIAAGSSVLCVLVARRPLLMVLSCLATDMGVFSFTVLAVLLALYHGLTFVT